MTTLESLKNLSVASGCGECTSDNVADAIQFIADHIAPEEQLKTVSGTSIHITDATAKPIQSFSMGGYKNLYPNFIEDATYTNGSTVTVNNDGSITVHKVAGDTINQNDDFYLPAGTYTISSGSSEASLVYLEVANLTDESHVSTYNRLVDTDAISGGTARFYLYVETGVEGDVTLKPQLEAGSTATEYAKYKSCTVTVNDETFNYPLYETLPTLDAGTNDITNADNANMSVTYYAN